MKLAEAIENEKNRGDDALNIIFLHNDGKFFHIYNWSAWLVKTFVCTEDFQKNRGDEKLLTVKRYKGKKGEYAIIGFPVESLSKYIPDYENIASVDDSTLKLSLSLEGMDEPLQPLYEGWYESLPIEERTKSAAEVKRGASPATFLARSGMFSIAAKVLSYPVECSTPAENIEFISNLKRELAGLLL